MRFLFGECTLDAEARELKRAGRTVHVEPQVFDVLVHLINRHDRVVSKDELIAGVWQGRIVSDSTLSSRITAARQAIGDTGKEQALIRTIARRGFRFVGDLREVPSAEDDLIAVSPSAEANKPVQAIDKRQSADDSRRHADDEKRPASLPPALAIPDKPSIAVLAFGNLSGDPEQEYFADGIAEDIITTLSKLRSLFVISRNSSFSYRGKPVDIRRIGSELGVRYVLEGSVRKGGTRVRITGQLVEAETGVHLWADRYDRELTDIFAVQDEITESVAMAVEPAMAQAERLRVSRKPPDSLVAWEAYHRGLWHFLKQEPSENDQAKGFFQRAIDLDPGFAGGFYGLALTHLWDCWVYVSRPVQDCVSVALPLAHRALKLDDADPMVHFVISCALMMGGDVDEAVPFAQQAVSLNPNNAWAVGFLGGLSNLVDYLGDGQAGLRKAIRISPHDPMLWTWTHWSAIGHYFAGDYSAALETSERVIRLRPDQAVGHRWKAAALAQLDRLDEARKALQRAIEISPANVEFYRHIPPWYRRRSTDYARLLEGLRKAWGPD